MAASAIAPLLRRLSGEGKKGKKVTLTDNQSEDAMNVLATLSLNAYCLGVLAGNGGLNVLAAFCHNKSNRKNIGALAPTYLVCARMVGSTPHLATEAVQLGLIKSAAAALSPLHKRADLPMKRAAAALLLATASYPEHREICAVCGAIFGASHLLMYGGKLARLEAKGTKKKSLEDTMRASAFVKKKVQTSVSNEKIDPLPANSMAEQLCCALLWYTASCSSNRLMIIRAKGQIPICNILRRESEMADPTSNDSRTPKIPRDVIKRLENAALNRKKGFNERKFIAEDAIATEHTAFCSAESSCGVVWNLLADSIAQLAVLEEKGPSLLCYFAESTIDKPAPSRDELASRWGSPEKSMVHLALLFPGKDKDELVESQEKAAKTADVLKRANEIEDPVDDVFKK